MIYLSDGNEFSELCEIYSQGLRKVLDKFLFGYWDDKDIVILYQIMTIDNFKKIFTDGDYLYIQFNVINDNNVCIAYTEHIGHVLGIINIINEYKELSSDDKNIIFNKITSEVN